MNNITVTIARETYERLQEDSNFLHELEAFGVDNWDGYSDAKRSLRQREADIARATT